ncbi:DAK2 domain-containing protein [Actinomyces wuliandei]|uniref:DAK2 domain-containing protein n=1 Tax=Actinomyces wuliandei TaxID=2057743 RepID=UPI000FD873CD|nr:DAK2 domain-containing protein [Actinomyces wuliandei]
MARRQEHARAGQGAPAVVLGGATIRHWILLAEAVAVDVRDLVDALNVFPVPDADTGTNVLLTLRSATEGLERVPSSADAVQVSRAVADSTVRGARGNSGLLVSQALSALADVCAQATDPSGLRAVDLVHAVERMASTTWAAVSRPVTGTLLTVVRDAATAARRALDESTPQAPASLSAVAAAAAFGAQESVVETVGLGHGPVDAGAAAVMLLLTGLSDSIDATGATGAADVGRDGGAWQDRAPYTAVAYQMLRELAAGGLSHGAGGAAPGAAGASSGEFEVMYLLEATADQAARLREDLERVGDSVGVVGTPDALGVGLYQVHVHTDTPRAALPRQGRARQTCIHHLHPTALVAPAEEPPSPWSATDSAGHVVSFERLAARRAERRAQSVRMHPSQAVPHPGLDTAADALSAGPVDSPGPLPRPGARSRRVGVIACTRAPGLVEQLARTGAVVVLDPDRDAVVRAAGDLGVAQVVVLPCDAASTQVAHEAARFLAARSAVSVTLAASSAPEGGRRDLEGGGAARHLGASAVPEPGGPQLLVCDTDNEARVLAAAVAVAGQGQGVPLADLAQRASQAGARIRTLCLGGAEAEPEAVVRAIHAALRPDDELLTVVTGRHASRDVAVLVVGALAQRGQVTGVEPPDDDVPGVIPGVSPGVSPGVEVAVHAGGQEEPDVLVAIE